MTRWTVLTIAAVANVIAVVAIVAALWWGGEASTAKTLALTGTAVIATASLVILVEVFRRARSMVHESDGLPHDHSGWPHQPPPPVDVEFRDRGQRFGPL
jgi:hypothetical protein